MSSDAYAFSVNGLFYIDAPEDWTEYETGEIKLSSKELALPGDLTIQLQNLKSAEYANIESKHLIKLTSSLDNVFYICIPEESQTGHQYYIDKINQGIEAESNKLTKEEAINIAKDLSSKAFEKFKAATNKAIEMSKEAYSGYQAIQQKAEEGRRITKERQRAEAEQARIREEKAAIKIDCDAVLYPDAPDSFDESSEGKLILNRTDLILPSKMKFDISKLKNAKYEKFEDKHIIKVTTTSKNELYFTPIDATKLKCIQYVETINDAIENPSTQPATYYSAQTATNHPTNDRATTQQHTNTNTPSISQVDLPTLIKGISSIILILIFIALFVLMCSGSSDSPEKRECYDRCRGKCMEGSPCEYSCQKNCDRMY